MAVHAHPVSRVANKGDAAELELSPVLFSRLETDNAKSELPEQELDIDSFGSLTRWATSSKICVGSIVPTGHIRPPSGTTSEYTTLFLMD